MWLFSFASTSMVVFFIAYCAILACWILVAAVRTRVEINQRIRSESAPKNHSRPRRMDTSRVDGVGRPNFDVHAGHEASEYLKHAAAAALIIFVITTS